MAGDGPLAMECHRFMVTPTSISKLGLQLNEPHRPHDRPRGGRGGPWAAQVHPEPSLPREAGRKNSSISVKGAGDLEIHNGRREEKVEARRVLPSSDKSIKF